MTTDSQSSKSPGEPEGSEAEEVTQSMGTGDHRIPTGSFEISELAYTHIGRYKILSQLGRGGFGLVFRAFDPDLNCQVAIKTPRPDCILRPGELERFRNEARTLARIRNLPSIVTVYDVGQTDDGIVYAVMEFVEGEPLSRFIESRQVSIEESLLILSRIAEALTAAHQATIVHRDLKPSNVILDSKKNITLVDFGLALHDDLSLADLGDSIEGTPRYMAPEQIRGENHRINGQTDIWAFGVIMYRMLTGKHPFRGSDTRELAREIRYRDARPLRQLNPEISREVERICLKCLSRNMSDRYLSVSDLMEDLTRAMEESRSTGQPAVTPALQVLEQKFAQSEHVPGPHDSRGSGASGKSGPSTGTDTQGNQLQITYKGLRPFDSNDSGFFQRLLPGPRNREGIPESIQFWRSRILGDELEPLEIGLVYGPSGCGKSSFVRAGLLPVLPARINPVYIECTGEGTERRLAQQIAHRIHSVDARDTLPDILRQIRRGDHLDPDDKLLIVLDQFEQWLHGKNGFETQELVEALRQCDGEKTSCVLLIRDDFWMSTSEFMKTLDIPIREGHNALALPLFDERHARKVLVAYGRSMDRLPASGDEQGISLNSRQKKFVRDAVKSLVQNGKVICVHLSVFAQIAKDREWTSGELNRLGGLKGVGVRFLEDLFPSSSSSKFRNDQDEIVKSILEQLLPDNQAQIKGSSRTVEELWNRLDSQYPKALFETVLERLASEYRLISAVDDRNQEEGSGLPPESYRLTHDFLVTPIRNWLERKQKDTWQGRARFRMEELGMRWAESHDRRFIPAPLEYVQVFWSARKPPLRSGARELLNRSHVYYASWLGAISLTVLSVSALVLYLLDQSASRTAMATYRAFLEAPPTTVVSQVDRVHQYQRHIRGILSGSTLENPSPQMDLRCSMAAVVCGLNMAENARKMTRHFGEMETGDVINTQYIFERYPGRVEFVAALGEAYSRSISNLERARIAAVAAALGDLDCLEQTVAIDADQTDRTLLICNFDEWVTDNNLAFEILKTSASPEVQASILAVMALQRPEVHTAKAHELKQLVQHLYSSHGDRTIHGLARTLASRYGWTLAEGSSPANADWHVVTGFELTFVRISEGQLEVSSRPVQTADDQLAEPVKIDSFWICDQEITNRLFDEFLQDGVYAGPKPDPALFRLGSRDDSPVTGVALGDVKMFCNWLSEKTGRSKVYLLENEKWQSNPAAGGFRVPTLYELEYATRSGGATDLHIGDISINPFVNLFENRHAGELGAPDFSYLPVRQRLPNYWGLFDTMGNAAELCTGPGGDDQSFSRGLYLESNVGMSEKLYFKDSVSGTISNFRQPGVGFRPAISAF